MEGIHAFAANRKPTPENPGHDEGPLAQWPELKDQLDAWCGTGPNQRSVEASPASLGTFADYISLDKQRITAVKAYLDALPPAQQDQAAEVQKHLWWQVTKILSKG